MISIVSPRTRNAPREKLVVVALVLHADEATDEYLAVDPLADLERDHRVQVLLGGTEAVDAGHAGDHDHVAPAQERVRGGVAQPLDLVVDRGVLLDEGVRLRHIGLGLVVVVVGDEVLDRVVGHQLAELVRQLRRERLVVREYEGRALHLLDEPGGGRRLAGTRGAEQDDVGLTGVDALSELLIACGWSPLGEYSLITSKGCTERVGMTTQPA